MTYTDLTKRQNAVLKFIKDEVLFKGYPPTVREICEAVGLSSPSTVHFHLKALEEKGYLRRDPSKPRAMEIVNFSDFREQQIKKNTALEQLNSPNKEMTNIPIVGTITAGIPMLAEEMVEDVFPIPMDFINSNQQLFMLKVSGESMIEAGILDGDMIVVEKTLNVRNGDIAAILIEDSATVKYYFKEKDHFRLEPANSTMSSIIVPEVTILGKVIALLRRF